MNLMESAPGAKTIIDGKEVDYFSGCGYFGLQGHPEVIRAACDATKKYGMGTATSRSCYGTNRSLLDVERSATKFFETESSLYFASGYLGNSILLKGLEDDYDVIFADEESHYSCFDGAAITGKPLIRFRHLDAEDLKRKLRYHLKPFKRPAVVSDGIFPVSGEIPPLPDYIEVLKRYDGHVLCIDDAHAVGVLGEKGQGTFEYFGIKGEGMHFSGTLSKAVGGFGGIIPGSEILVEKMTKKSKIPFSSSPLPPAAAAATAKAIELLMENPGWRKKLWENVIHAKEGLMSLGFPLDSSHVPIICLRAPAGVDLRRVERALYSEGIVVFYFEEGAYSGVPEGGVIRIAIFSTHTKEQIDRLIQILKIILSK